MFLLFIFCVVAIMKPIDFSARIFSIISSLFGILYLIMMGAGIYYMVETNREAVTTSIDLNTWNKELKPYFVNTNCAI